VPSCARPLRITAPGPDTPYEYVRARQHVVGHAPFLAGVRARSERHPYWVEAGSASIERPLDVAHNDVVHTVGQHDLGTGHARSAGAHDDDLDLRGTLFDDPERIHERGEYPRSPSRAGHHGTPECRARRATAAPISKQRGAEMSPS